MSGSFMYPRSVSITRPMKARTAGANGYSGLNPLTEPPVPIAQNMPATIQINRVATRPTEHLPADAEGKPKWNVYVPLPYAPPDGSVVDNDSVIDDLGRRFQVIAATWLPLGMHLLAQIEKT